jgi:hypothetical protein
MLTNGAWNKRNLGQRQNTTTLEIEKDLFEETIIFLH